MQAADPSLVVLRHGAIWYLADIKFFKFTPEYDSTVGRKTNVQKRGENVRRDIYIPTPSEEGFSEHNCCVEKQVV